MTMYTLLQRNWCIKIGTVDDVTITGLIHLLVVYYSPDSFAMQYFGTCMKIRILFKENLRL